MYRRVGIRPARKTVFKTTRGIKYSDIIARMEGGWVLVDRAIMIFDGVESEAQKHNDGSTTPIDARSLSRQPECRVNRYKN